MSLAQTSYTHLLATYLKPQWVRVLLLAVMLFSTIGLQLANPQILRAFIDQASSGGSLDVLIRIALLFIGMALLNQVVTVIATYLGELIGWVATNALRADLSLHCLRLDMSFHKAQSPGVLIERVDGDITALSNFFSQFILKILGNLLLLIGVLVVLFWENLWMGVALSVFALVALLTLSLIRNIAVPATKAERVASADLIGMMEEHLTGLNDLRANGAGAYTLSHFHRLSRLFLRRRQRAQAINFSLWVTTTALFAVGYILALGLGAYLFQSGAISIGTVYLLFQYTRMLRTPLEEVTRQLREFQRAAASIVRIRELYAIRSNLPDTGTALLPDGPLAVEFDRVTFSYDDAEYAPSAATSVTNPSSVSTVDQPNPPIDIVLQDLSFRLEPGQVLGLLGRTGSGKTTLSRLLFRLYDPSAGHICFNGIDLRAVPLAELRQRVGIVTQEVQIFRASLRDNLTLFEQGIPDEQIVQILTDLGLEEWYRSQPQGLDTMLSSGGVSAGEAQLLAFARVFLRDPGLVILDEASSRLDPATERLIEDAVDKLLHNRTAIIIAHRLASVQHTDMILILDDGHVSEYGPRHLLAQNPNSRFAQLLRVGMEEVLG